MSYPIREGLPPMSPRIAKLRRDERGYPVPFFVEWIDGKPDFRVMDSQRRRRCYKERLCWVCGEKLGKYLTFVLGPMCAITRTSAEPPCHHDCAEWSARACPFLTLPRAKRREANLPADGIAAPGIALSRNPGCVGLWTTHDYKAFNAGNGTLFQVGEPLRVEWFALGRVATREEVMASIDSGYPSLLSVAQAEGEHAIAELSQYRERALRYLPVAA